MYVIVIVNLITLVIIGDAGDSFVSAEDCFEEDKPGISYKDYFLTTMGKKKESQKYR
ncbi:hypothetical protein M6B38_182660 [Iris pallida]|uniref:Uncharacterized protein n=1 Tax=Iris pallida TaxID=29817 RepID=A0AAX6EKW4_IRIPA|nr:hypothetical protein M6B38_182660 [Iris pallida]